MTVSKPLSRFNKPFRGIAKRERFLPSKLNSPKDAPRQLQRFYPKRPVHSRPPGNPCGDRKIAVGICDVRALPRYACADTGRESTGRFNDCGIVVATFASFHFLGPGHSGIEGTSRRVPA